MTRLLVALAAVAWLLIGLGVFVHRVAAVSFGSP